MFETIERPHNPAMDELLNKGFTVLDKGHIRVVDYMGDDAAIVQAARVSYGKGTKQVSEDRGLIRYLMRHRHTTPFEMCEIKLHVRVPMDHWRQWIRHRTANVNEYSTRYSEAIDDRQETLPGEWRFQSGANKQGSGDCIDPATGAFLTLREQELHEEAWNIYEERLAKGVAREQARKDLPLSTYTEAYWKIDLHNLFHFLSLRMDSHAQKEIRAYADVIGNEIVARWVPDAWQAFCDYRLNGMFLSALDIEMLATCSHADPIDSQNDLADKLGWHERREDGTLKNNRERSEFEAKATRLGLTFEWD